MVTLFSIAVEQNSTTLAAGKKSTVLLAHNSAGQKSGSDVGVFTGQGHTKLKSHVSQGCSSHLGLRVHLHPHSGCWQNLFPFICTTEVLVFPLAVRW